MIIVFCLSEIWDFTSFEATKIILLSKEEKCQLPAEWCSLALLRLKHPLPALL